MIQISYAGYNFHDTGIPLYGMTMRNEGGNMPSKTVTNYKVKQRFFEGTFAENEAQLTALKLMATTTPRGRLLIVDEADGVLVDVDAKIGEIDTPEEWGQHRREVTVMFEAFAPTLSNPVQTASYTPLGGKPVSLPNVGTWNGAVKVRRASYQVNNREESIETVSASGKLIANPAAAYADRRDALLAAQAQIKGIADCRDGVLAFGSFSQTMRVDDVRADIGDGQEELTWTLDASARRFPGAVYAESEYEVTSADNLTAGETLLSVTGKVLADTLEHAEAEALRIKALYVNGRVMVEQELKHRELSGTDGDAVLELSFSFRFKETLNATVWDLKVATRSDIRTGDITTVYSGKVHAPTAAAAIAKARALGFGKMPFLLQATEDMNTAGNDSGTVLLMVDFTYEYLGKGAVLFAEVKVENEAARFGLGALNVSGYAVGATADAALAFARTFKQSGKLIRSEHEGTSTQQEQKGLAPVIHFNRIDFSYQYGTPVTGVSMNYGIETEADYKTNIQTTTITGVAYGANEAAVQAVITSVMPTGSSLGNLIRKKTGKQYEQNDTSATRLLREISFSSTWSGVLGYNGILEAEYSVDIGWPVWKSQVDEIPYGNPYVQSRVYLSTGSVSVSGTVMATSWILAQSWARSKRSLATGYLEQVNERQRVLFQELSGTNVRAFACDFTYASKDVNLAVFN